MCVLHLHARSGAQGADLAHAAEQSFDSPKSSVALIDVIEGDLNQVPVGRL